MAHLSNDETVAKMGHPVFVGQSDARYQLFLSGEGEGSFGFGYLKKYPTQAVERKPKPTRIITVTRTPRTNVIMLPPWP